jgi:hypothetical protein
MTRSAHQGSARCWKAAALTVMAPLFILTAASAQQDTTARTTTIRPSFSLGAGMFAFTGDVGFGHRTFSPLVSRVGFDLRATTPVTPWLEAGLYALHGRLGVNERSTTRNLNLDSRITTGGFQLRYNFLHLLNPGRTVEPFVTVGFESVEFLTKTDLYDAQGRRYHYWSDGSIRDIDEAADNAQDAVIIQRDYSYETDVRELNADGFGKYLERTWAVPVGVGVRMDLGGGFDARFSTTMHYTFSDLIDGVTDQSVESRRGDGRNDRFIYSSFSIGYAIPLERSKRKPRATTPLDIEQLDLIVLNEDEDGDGVPDHRDLCPFTPPGVKVDAFGCPLDRDSDGVPDHLDDEPDSAPGAVVDARGRTITDDMHLKAWLNWLDSGNVATDFLRVESFGPTAKGRRDQPKRVYVVKVGSQVEGISEELVQKLLSIPDVRTVVSGDTTYYVVGNYDNIPDALRRELELWGVGITGSVMAEEGGRLINIDDALKAERLKAPVPAEPISSKEAIIRVQLGAFRQRIPPTLFRDVPDVMAIKGDDGLTRYYTGSFTDVNDAAAHKVRMLTKGFDGAFLVAFRDGKRIPLKDAGARLTAPEQLGNVVAGRINKDLIRFRVQVGTFAGNVPIEAMELFIEIGDVEPKTSADAVRYYHGRFSSRSAADQARRDLQQRGLTDAFVVGDIDGTIVPAEEADRLLREP